jgi:predicted transcriptional regulator of viral defense system
MAELRERIEQKIRKMGRRRAFSRKDLSDIAPSGQVGVVLSRLVASGMIRRIGRGLYDYPGRSGLVRETGQQLQRPAQVDAT